MAQVLRVINDPFSIDGVTYYTQVCGRPNGHIWEGWIEFAAEDGSAVRRTPRETTQPDRDALAYWAEGLSGTYLEGAFARTRTTRVRVEPAKGQAYFNGPKPTLRVPAVEPAAIEVDRAVLDPFSVGAKGEELLRRELAALADWHLRNIILAYDLADPSLDLEQLATVDLIELIVAAVQPA